MNGPDGSASHHNENAVVLHTLRRGPSRLAAQRGDGNRELCRYFLTGRCRFGSSCIYSHQVPPEEGIDEARRQIPCKFYQQGNCRHGDRCWFSHEDTGAAVEIKASVESAAAASSNDAEENDNELLCGICLENIVMGQELKNKGGKCMRFGLLSGCEHVFCWACLMKWRKEGTEEADNRRCCPTCRELSDFVVPSHFFPKTEHDKRKVFDEYKAKLSLIPCKRFNGELGSCIFGRDCMFFHKGHDGTDMKEQDKTKAELYLERRDRRISGAAARRRRGRRRRRLEIPEFEMEAVEGLLYALQQVQGDNEQDLDFVEFWRAYRQLEQAQRMGRELGMIGLF